MKAMARNAFARLLGLSLLAGASAAVASPQACAPKVEKAWIRAAPPTATVFAGYATVRNGCDRPFVLVGIKAKDFMMAQVHETRISNGDSTMRHAKRTVLPARGLLRFAPGGYHLMLMHPRRKLPEGTVVPVELLLEDGRRIPVEMTVRREAP
jgi:copper(I)-binding protein